MRAELVTLTDNTDGFATVLIARGAGSGINRPQVTVRNEAAIEVYGVREAVHDFTATNLDDLVQQAEAKLAEVSNPARFQTVEIRVFGDDVPLFQLGDRVRFSDSRLGMTTTAEITELRWRDDSVVLALGELPVNLVGLFTADRDAERAEAALGLAVPTGLRVVGTLSGLDVSVNAFAGSRAVGIEVHVSSRAGFEPGAHTLAAEVFSTRASINGLVPGVRYYVVVRAFDERGFRSGFTPVVAGVVKLVGEEGLEPDLAEAVRHAEIVGEVVDAGREVWDLANSIPDLLDTLDLEPDDDGQFHAIQQNAAGVSSIVGKLGLSPSDPLQFSSIKQTATEISSVVSTLDLDADDPLQFSSIKQTASGIHSIVATLDGDPDDAEQFSSIRQLVDEIDLRVAQGEVISSINLSAEGTRIAGERIQLDGDVVVTGNVDITNSGSTNYRLQVKDAADNLQIAVGNLTGLSLPPGQSYGFYGKLGTGVFIEGMVEPVFTTPVQAIFPQITSQTSLAVTEFDITQLYGISPPNPLAVEFDVHASYDYRIRLSLVSNNRSTAGGDLLMMSANFYNAIVQPRGGGGQVIIPLSYGHWVDLSSYIIGPVVITKIGVSIMHIGSRARTWQSIARPIVLDIERKLKPI